MGKIVAAVEAVGFTIQLDRLEAERLRKLIYRHGDSRELNALGQRLEELLKPETWEREA